MKALVNLLVVAAAGFLGYAFEPNLRLELTGISHLPPQKQEVPGNQEEVLLSKVDPRAYDPDQLPKELVLKTPADVSDSTGVKVSIPAGTKVKFIALKDGMLVVSHPSIATLQGEVEIQNTDMREQIIANPPSAVAAAPKAPAGMDAMAKNEPGDTAEPAADPAAEKPADAMAKNDPADAAEGGDASMKEPTPGSNPALAPATGEPAPAPTAEFAPLGQDEIVKIMQESIRSGQVKSFKVEDVSEWTAGEAEEVNGVKFNVGMVTYTGTTFMGKSQLRGKAFISGGKVHNWINPKSGTDLK